MPNITEAKRHLAKAREAVEAAAEATGTTRRNVCLFEVLVQLDLAEQELEEEDNNDA